MRGAHPGVYEAHTPGVCEAHARGMCDNGGHEGGPSVGGHWRVARAMIALRKVSKRYGATIALDDVSLDVESGEAYVLLARAAAASPRCCA